MWQPFAGWSCGSRGALLLAWQTRVSSHCPLRKCRENSFPGWSDSLIHSALLDLRLTVQLLPINVKTGEKKSSGKYTEGRRPLSFTPQNSPGSASLLLSVSMCCSGIAGCYEKSRDQRGNHLTHLLKVPEVSTG
ncbi:hypothetical protein F7725_008041, partial [Dissostichus mawsoni]